MGERETAQPHPDVMCQNIIEYVKSKGHMWKWKVDGQSNHLRTLVWVHFICAMPGECCQKTDSKAHHLKSMAERDNPLSMQGISSETHDWYSMMVVIQNMGDITLFWAINILFQNGVITDQIIQLREISLCFLENQRKWIRQTKRPPSKRDIQII
jgi:hypothetical protein